MAKFRSALSCAFLYDNICVNHRASRLALQQGTYFHLTVKESCSLSVHAELPKMERRSMSHGSRLHSLGASQKSKLSRIASQQRFTILNELEKGQL